MTEFDDLDPNEEPTDAADDRASVAAFGALLADDSTWTPAPVGLADRVLEAIAADPHALTVDPDPGAVDELAERRGATAPSTDTPDAGAAVIDLASRRRAWPRRALAAAAAVVAVVVGVTAFSSRTGDDGVAVELAGTELAPEAAATVELIETPDGTLLRLDIAGLPAAGPDEYYEAWMRQSPEVGVSAGTFHFRGGGGEPIGLWTAVSPADYPLITVTLQDIDGGPMSSGRVVLRGRLGE